MTEGPGIDCARLLQEVTDYLDQDLDAATCGAIEAHSGECQSCRELIEGLRRTVGLCRETQTRPLPPAVKARAQAAIQRLLGRS